MKINVFCTVLVLNLLNYSAVHAVSLLQGFPESNKTFPQTLDGFKLEKHIVGGSGGVSIIMHAKTGKRYTLKCRSDQDSFKEEILTDGLYRALGVSVPDFALYSSAPESLFTLNEDCKKATLFRLSEYIQSDVTSPRAEIIQKLKDHFVADALLSNWDIVAGSDFKNVILDKEGTLWRIDNGGGLRYRAKGYLKQTLDHWSPSWVIDLATMRNPDLNTNGAIVYKDVSQDEIRKQARSIVLKADVFFKAFDTLSTLLKIRETTTLRNNLAARFQDLHDRFAVPLNPHEVRPADRLARAKPGYTAANVFLYTFHQGIPRVLLGKRAGSNQWGLIGGESDELDTFLSDTARQEILEGSFERIQLTERDLAESPSHDFISNQYLLRTYFIQHHYISAESLNALVNEDKDDLIEFAWVPIDRLLDSLLHRKNFVRTLKGEWTSTFTLNEKTQDLHAPFFLSSRQRPVLSVLESLIHLRKPNLQRTMELESPIDHQTGPKGLAQVPNFKSPMVNWGLGELDSIRSVSTKKHAPAFELKLQDQLKHQKQFVDAILTKAQALGKIKARAEPTYTDTEKQDAKYLKETPFTQSEAHLKLIMKDQFQPRFKKVTRAFQSNKAVAKQNIESFLKTYSGLCDQNCSDPNDTFITSLNHALTAELDRPQDFVFYHGTHSLIGFMYDLYTEFRRQLMILDHQQMIALRGSNVGFDRFRDAQDFYRIFAEQGQGGNKINYREVEGKSFSNFGLSVNPFLFGSDGHPTSATYYLFYQGETVSPPALEKMFHALIDPLGISINFEKYLTLHDNYYENTDANMTTAKLLDNPQNREKMGKTNGRLFQIFVQPSVVNQVAYLAKAGGREIEFSDPFTPERPKMHIKDILYLLRSSPDFAARQMPLLLKDKYTDEERPTFENIQTRLFLDPKIFLDPKYVQIRNYSRFPLRPALEDHYKKTLRDLVSEDLSKWLNANLPVVPGAFTTDSSSNQTHPPLQQMYKKVVEGVTGKPIDIAYPELVTMIEGNQLRILRNYLHSHPHVNLNTKIFSPTQKKSLYPLELAYDVSSDMFLLLLEHGADLIPPAGINGPTDDDDNKSIQMETYVLGLYEELSMDDPEFKHELMTLTRAVLKNDVVAPLLYIEDSGIRTKEYIAYFLAQANDLDFYTLLVSATDGRKSERLRFLHKLLSTICIQQNNSDLLRQLLQVSKLTFSVEQFKKAAEYKDLEIFDLLRQNDRVHLIVYAKPILTHIASQRNALHILSILKRFEGVYGKQMDQFENLIQFALDLLILCMDVGALETYRTNYGFKPAFKANGLKLYADALPSLTLHPILLDKAPDVLEYLLEHVDVTTLYVRRILENMTKLETNLAFALNITDQKLSLGHIYSILYHNKLIGPGTANPTSQAILGEIKEFDKISLESDKKN